MAESYGIDANLIAMQDARNGEVYRYIIDRPIREASKQLAAAREDYARRLLKERLPQRLHWAINRSRALKLVLRFVPRWRPTFTVVRLEHPAHPLGAPDHLRGMPVMTANAANAMARTWVREMRAKGNSVPDSGLIFTYTDASGLPAEVYGAVG